MLNTNPQSTPAADGSPSAAASPRSTVHSPQSTAHSPQPTAHRLTELDWTKGALVLCMIVYHAICYSAFRPTAFEYMAFLPPSFILIAGFVVGQIYAAKYDLTSFAPYLRLGIRGLKILVLFIVLNILNCIMMERSIYEGFWEFGMRADGIFLSGNGRVGIFEVLLPIGYFLLVAPVLLWARRLSRWIIPCVAVAIFCANIWLNFDNLAFLSAGIIGMALGLVPIKSINRIARNWVAVLGAYGVYQLIRYKTGETYPVQMLAAAVSVLLLYAVALRVGCSGWTGRQVVLLGNYSLFAYLLQIPVLRGLVKVTGGQPQAWLRVWLIIIAATVIVWGIVVATDFLRKRAKLANAAYKAVFA